MARFHKPCDCPSVFKWTSNRWERSCTHLEISLKSKVPSYPKINPARVIRSFANGGCTSTKNWVLIYFEANLPKWTSSKLRKLSYRSSCWGIGDVETHTTLPGCEMRNNLTKHATTTTRIKSFHSPELTFKPPGLVLLPAKYGFDACVRRSSASRCSCFGCGNRGCVGGGA